MKKKESGFTLIEALFVLFLFSILASLAVPSFAISSKQKVADQLAEQIRQSLEEVRMLAIVQEGESKVIFHPTMIVLTKPDQSTKQLTIPKQCIIKQNFRKNQLIYRYSGQAVGGRLQIKCDHHVMVALIVQVGSGRVILEVEK